jgi:hypothetical protein
LPQSAIDISALLVSEDIDTADHIWQVQWQAALPDSLDSCELSFVRDSTNVLSGPDGMLAIKKVRAHVLNPLEGPERSSFRLLGLKLLAIAEIK